MTAVTLNDRARTGAVPDAQDAGAGRGGWFEAEVQPHLQVLNQRARRLTGDAESADDLLQDTLERAYRKRALYQRGTGMRSWLLCIMRNVWISSHRRRSAQPNTVSLDALDEVSLHRRSAREAAGASSAVERSIVDGLGEKAILRAIATLPPALREVVTLADLQDRPYRAIAEALQIPI